MLTIKSVSLPLVRVLAFVTMCLFSSYSYAKDVEIDGILVNKTITWFGQDFFNHFAQEWRNQFYKGEGVVVEERPSARQGTLVIIRYKGSIVYQASIAGTRSNSRERGAQAVSFVLSRVQNIDLAASGYGERDLAPDEI
ncbi:MAG: curli production assembly/transport protein CsgE [Agarilytica sp.]